MTEKLEPDAPTPPAKSGLATFMSLFPSIMLPMFLAMADQTILAAALPAIAGDLGNASRVSWVVTGYLVAATIAAPVYGRLGDLLGRKRLMFFALTVMGGASLLCFLSTSVEMLAAARVLQGFGGGGLMTLSQALIGEAVPPRQRAKYQGFFATIAVFSSTFGAIAGGLLTVSFGWRSIFLVSLPIALVAMLLLRTLPTRPPAGGSKRFDVPGLFLFATFIVSALTLLNQVHDFGPGMILTAVGLLAVCIAALIILVWRENRATSPLFPIPLLRLPAIWRSDLVAMCHGALLVSLVTFLPIYFRVSGGADAAAIGFLLLPVTMGVPLGSVITGQLVSRTGYTAIFPSFGLAVAVVLLAGISIFLPHLGMTEVSWLLGLSTVFMGTVMGVVQLTVQITAGPAMLGTASASVQYSRSIGAALGTATVSAVLFATLAAQDNEAAQLFVAILQQGPDILASVPAARRAVVQGEISDAFRNAFLTMTAFAAVSVVLCWTLPMRRI